MRTRLFAAVVEEARVAVEDLEICDRSFPTEKQVMAAAAERATMKKGEEKKPR
ncbi:hypothetical protein HBI10_124490 [Parastagonospora nodorum]|nr:hypothetical protein HBI10_124490 [Parastagonospora nodorum]